jgi:protein-tyrosine-phosphatase
VLDRVEGRRTDLAADRAIAWSGGSEPGIEVNPAAVAAMAERGIDISGEYPKPWTDEVVRAADVVVTMGCGDACPIFPGTRYENWDLDDPADRTVENVRPIRDEIERRVRVYSNNLACPLPSNCILGRRRDVCQVVSAEGLACRPRSATLKTATTMTPAPSHCLPVKRSASRKYPAATPKTGIRLINTPAAAAGISRRPLR